MEQLNQILIEGLMIRSTDDVYLLTNNNCMSITVYIMKDTVKEKLRKDIKDKAVSVRIIGSLRQIYKVYYIDAEFVEVKPSEIHKE